jgi:hypothetical protein
VSDRVMVADDIHALLFSGGAGQREPTRSRSRRMSTISRIIASGLQRKLRKRFFRARICGAESDSLEPARRSFMRSFQHQRCHAGVGQRDLSAMSTRKPS